MFIFAVLPLPRGHEEPRVMVGDVDRDPQPFHALLEVGFRQAFGGDRRTNSLATPLQARGQASGRGPFFLGDRVFG
jgi:hypothetical protein